MKIYTKKGDKGNTSLIGGVRLPKNNIRIEAYGTVDELNSFIGLVRDQEGLDNYKADLIHIQDVLFIIGSHLASHPEKAKMKLPSITGNDIEQLEKAIDSMDQKLEPMTNFILPGGHPSVSVIHVCRSVCRRAERRTISLLEAEPVEDIIVAYLNRLSDYLFMLSRAVSNQLKIEEIPWNPRS